MNNIAFHYYMPILSFLSYSIRMLVKGYPLTRMCLSPIVSNAFLLVHAFFLFYDLHPVVPKCMKQLLGCILKFCFFENHKTVDIR